jgi:beta-N-acetylhexosaminidase
MSNFIVMDIDGITLPAEERELLEHPSVAGVILFSRNFESVEQLKALTAEIRRCKPSLLIFVDQEGGRVQRFNEGVTQISAMRNWGELYLEDPEKARNNLFKAINLQSSELRALGVHVNLVPVLDLDFGLNDVIAERSFGRDPNLVTELASVVLQALGKNNMPAVAKHFPGHGAVFADSHKALPVDNRSWQDVYSDDMFPYRQMIGRLDMIMTAHVLFPCMDDKPATFSSFWLQDVLRKKLDFGGVIVSDCLSMEATAVMGGYPDRAHAALEAGCDVLLICNSRSGVIEVLDTLRKVPYSEPAQRIKQAQETWGS